MLRFVGCKLAFIGTPHAQSGLLLGWMRSVCVCVCVCGGGWVTGWGALCMSSRRYLGHGTYALASVCCETKFTNHCRHYLVYKNSLKGK